MMMKLRNIMGQRESMYKLSGKIELDEAFFPTRIEDEDEDKLLARAENSGSRFYNISSQINKNKNRYYDILEKIQHGDGEITEWIAWYAKSLSIAISEADSMIVKTLNKSIFWQKSSTISMNERQTKMLNRFLDGYEAKITSKNWAALAKCSKDTAIRDIQYLCEKNILVEDTPGAKRPSYSIVYANAQHDIPT